MHKQIEKQLERATQRILYYVVQGTRVSYRQLGSDTKLCGTPIQMIGLPHIPVPETLDICQLDNKGITKYILMAPSSGGLQDTTRGEAPALAQHAHTTVCTLFIQH